MPCYDPRDEYDEAHNNVAAGLLCELLKRTPPESIIWTDELRQWWADHHNRDAYHERKAREFRR